jgi:type IV pilus assembly protein PilW
MTLNSMSLQQKLKQAGFSLVELMVAILIGLIILAGVIQVVFTSKTTFLGQEGMSFIQENARYATYVIGKDIQGAGHWGCAGESPITAVVAGAANTNAAEFIGLESLRGYADTSAPAAYSTLLRELPGGVKSESLLIRTLAGPAVSVQSHLGQTITLFDNHKFPDGDYLGIVAEDCRRVGVLRITTTINEKNITYASNNNNGASGIRPIDEDVNCSNNSCGTLSPQKYAPGSVVMQFNAHAYYVGDSNEARGNPALKRAFLQNGNVINEELALGVEDIHFRYGVRNGANLKYFKVADVPNWNQVIAVEVNLLMRSDTANLPAAQKINFVGTGREYNDRYMRQVVTTTFRVRNRI